MQTIPEFFLESANKHQKKIALLYKKEGVYFSVSYKELLSKVKNFAFILQDNFNVKKFDKVAILSENRPEWLISDLAIISIGAISVPLHTTLNPALILKILNHSEAKVIIISNSNQLNKILINKNDYKYLETIIILEKLPAIEKANLSIKVLDWYNLFFQNKSESFRKINIEAKDPCSIIYTSGTTGEAKGVVLSHENFLSNVKSINLAIPVKTEDVFLSFLPLSHALERTAGHFVPIFFGATIAYAESPKTLAKNLKEVKPTILIAVPKIFEKFHDAIWDKINKSSKIKKIIFKWALRQENGKIGYKIADFLVFKKIRNNLGGRLRLTISGGARLNENLVKFFLKLGILILEGYGLTETSPVISVTRKEDMEKFGKVGVGRVLENVHIKIANDKEILVKGPNVFSGYYKNIDESKKSFDKDGWFCTGDLGFIDKDHFLTVIGRRTEMIVLSGGKNIWPEPIENILNNDRFISQSMILGENQNFISALICPDWKEVESFFKENNLRLQSHHNLSLNAFVLKIFQERIDEKINSNLSDYEKIKKFVLLPEEFSQEKGELTPTLKLRRHVILHNYEKIIKNII
jgi:long-chain acyl-CoA synthetase